MIEISGVYKSFGDYVALHDINLFIQEGEIFGIIGKSGAGKSTLLRIINLLEQPDHGEVIVDNESIINLSAKALRQVRHKMSMIFQHFNLLNSKTVYDNIALPMRIQGENETIIKTKVEELSFLVELRDKLFAYPMQLSGGQKQRVAIARALSCSPKILLCDEATSSLDPTTTIAILDLLKKINHLYGITIVLITHEMDVIKRICHRVSLIEKGCILETASLDTILRNPESPARNKIFAQLSPPLPDCLKNSIVNQPNQKPLLRLFFQGETATIPFISLMSRELTLDITILLANIDRFNGLTCGVIVVELNANDELLTLFMQRCAEYQLTVEILGYVTDDGL